MLNTYPATRSPSTFIRLQRAISCILRRANCLTLQLDSLIKRLASCCVAVPVKHLGTQSDYRKARRCILGSLAALVIILPAMSAEATSEIQDLESIRQAVESFFTAQAPTARDGRNIAVSNVDQRLRLQACEENLVAFFPPGSRAGRNRTVGVSCAGPKPWTIYVSVRVRYRGNVVVAARALPRGVVIGGDDAVVEEQELNDGAFGYLTNLHDVLGKRTIRPLRSGTPITQDVLDAVATIVRGQRVLLVAQSPYLLVRMFGTALQDGAPGDRIRVENSKSKRIIEGIVDEGGVVRIQL